MASVEASAVPDPSEDLGSRSPLRVPRNFAVVV